MRGAFFIVLYLFNLVADASVPSIPHFSNRKCKTAYEQFYRREHVNIQIVFGYKDARPARFVGDRYERDYFIGALEKMGFRRQTDDDELFSHLIKGPDGMPKNVVLRLVGSSVGPDDDENRTNPYQKWQSRYAKKIFEDGLTHADVVLYYGHSRNGGGPDFSPPRLTVGSHVDYGWYAENKTGLNHLLRALSRRNRDPGFLGIFSCVSNRWFAKKVRKMSPETALLGTDSLIYFSDALEQIKNTLESLLEMKCQKDFCPSGTQLVGFF